MDAEVKKVVEEAKRNFDRVLEIYELNGGAVDIAAMLNEREQEKLHLSIVNAISLVRLSHREIMERVLR